MSFPAYEQISKDIDLGFARWKVYMHLVHGPVLNHHTPIEVKVAWLCAVIVRPGGRKHLSPRKVIDALDWLTEAGYLVEHSRDPRKVRSLTLAWEVQRRPDAHAA